MHPEGAGADGVRWNRSPGDRRRDADELAGALAGEGDRGLRKGSARAAGVGRRVAEDGHRDERQQANGAAGENQGVGESAMLVASPVVGLGVVIRVGQTSGGENRAGLVGRARHDRSF